MPQNDETRSVVYIGARFIRVTVNVSTFLCKLIVLIPH